MIRRLQIRLISLITFLLASVIIIVMFTINIISGIQSEQSYTQKLMRLAANDGMIAPSQSDPFTDPNSGYGDSLSVMLTPDNELRGIVFSRDMVISQDLIIDYVNQALRSGKERGTLGHYAYLIQQRYYGRIVVFLDITSTQVQARNLLLVTSLIGVISVLIFFFVAVVLSQLLIKPVRETFQKQKQFISDASHELKTPLAVISANADVLEGEIGENKWLGYIKNETVRMNELVNELLFLARLDDRSSKYIKITDFSLSDAVLQTALPFESRMFEANKTYELDVEENISYHGDASSIKHLVTILIDNALKYSEENGKIRVRLYTKGQKKILEVYNTGMGIPPEKADTIFERFYREDEARNRKTGGYGLGLSIARSIVELHNGKITVQSEYGKNITFTVSL